MEHYCCRMKSCRFPKLYWPMLFFFTDRPLLEQYQYSCGAEVVLVRGQWPDSQVYSLSAAFVFLSVAGLSVLCCLSFFQEWKGRGMPAVRRILSFQPLFNGDSFPVITCPTEYKHFRKLFIPIGFPFNIPSASPALSNITSSQHNFPLFHNLVFQITCSSQFRSIKRLILENI